jgi:hypothetical protein
MPRVIIVVREIGHLKPDYSLSFDLPSVPGVGSYLSIQRPDTPKPFGEDLVVRRVWWRLTHPETAGFATGGKEKIGSVEEIYVECDPALGPWSSDHWHDMMKAAEARGIKVEEFEVERLSYRQRDIEQKH